MASPPAIPTLSDIVSTDSPQTLVEQIHTVLPHLERRVKNLKIWFETIDSRNYQRSRPWQPHMEEAYKRYKLFDAELGVAHTAYVRSVTILRNADECWITPEDYLDCVRLATEWAKKAICSAHARLQFLERYRAAFRINQIEGHIQAGKDSVNSARQSAERITHNINMAIIKFGVKADPIVFE